MRSSSLRNTFWIVLVLTFVIGVFFDVIAFNQTKINNEIGDTINQINHRISEIDLQIFSLVNPTQSPQFAGLIVDRTQQVEKLHELIVHDKAENAKAQTEVMLASLIDIGLLFLLATIWLLDYRARRDTESALSNSMAAISKTNFDLEQANLAKAALLRNTVHDLKNPLGSIRGFAEIIGEDAHNQSVIEMSQMIHRISNKTLDLVNNLLNPATLDKGGSVQHIQPVNILACLNDVCLALKPQLMRKKQGIEIDLESQNFLVKAQPQRLWDLFMNIVGNACKFGPVNSTIYIRHDIFDEQVVIEIEDEGPGFTHEDQSKAFKPFQKLSARPTGGETSSGLGLAIAKQTVQDYGGTIEICKPIVKRGGCVRVTLPLYEKQIINKAGPLLSC